MPLSEHEQRLFEQIERSLAEDPKFASAVRASDPRFHARRRVLVAAGVVIAGLALLIYGAVIKTPPLAVAGFVVMLASLGYAVQSHRRSQSPDLHVVGGTTTNMVAYVSGMVFVQIWIGAEDNLPRTVRAVYRDDPLRLRHQLELSNWQLDLAVPADAFTSASASSAMRIAFARPDPQLPPGAKPPATGKSSKDKSSKAK